MIDFKIPGYAYPSAYPQPILAEQSFSLEKGEWTALMGSSGSGKSTLLRLLAGYLPCHKSLEDIAFLSQEASLLPWLSLKNNIGITDLLMGRRVDTGKAIHLLNLVGLGDDAHKKPHALSYGMQRRILLARTLYMDRPIIFLDEPFSAVDPETRALLYKQAKLWLKGKTVLFTTHQADEAKILADTIYELHGRPGLLKKVEGADA